VIVTNTISPGLDPEGKDRAGGRSIKSRKDHKTHQREKCSKIGSGRSVIWGRGEKKTTEKNRLKKEAKGKKESYDLEIG